MLGKDLVKTVIERDYFTGYQLNETPIKLYHSDISHKLKFWVKSAMCIH